METYLYKFDLLLFRYQRHVRCCTCLPHTIIIPTTGFTNLSIHDLSAPIVPATHLAVVEKSCAIRPKAMIVYGGGWHYYILMSPVSHTSYIFYGEADFLLNNVAGRHGKRGLNPISLFLRPPTPPQTA